MKRKYLEIHKDKEIVGRYEITGLDTDQVFDQVKPILAPKQEVIEVVTHRQLPQIELSKEFEIA